MPDEVEVVRTRDQQLIAVLEWDGRLRVFPGAEMTDPEIGQLLERMAATWKANTK